VGSCGHVLSCQVINAAASEDPDAGRAYPELKGPGRIDLMPGPIVGQGGRRNGQIGGEILPAHGYRKQGKAMAWITPRFSTFKVGGPFSLARSGGAIYGMGCTVPQPFVVGGNRSYQELWAVTCDPRY
jgi:hypothetical protein